MKAIEARIAIQKHLGVTADGDIGRRSWKAYMGLRSRAVVAPIQELLGFSGSDVDGERGPKTDAVLAQLDEMPDNMEWPPKKLIVAPPLATPSTSGKGPLAGPLGREAREKMFGGPFQWRRNPEPGNPENIVIHGDWEDDNIISVEIPQLKRVPGNFSRMRWNRRGVEQLRALWSEWEKAGLLGLILSYEGSFVPRLIRGSTTSLSNHAYGSAFDVNYHWNQLGRTPAKRGSTGSVHELVPLAHEHGFYWGGNFTRLDGMHFEICKLL